jgi:hypothetical protein
MISSSRSNMRPTQQSTKQPSIWKELLMVICMMLFLGAVGFGLAWHKGHTIWHPTIEEEY